MQAKQSFPLVQSILKVAVKLWFCILGKELIFADQ